MMDNPSRTPCPDCSDAAFSRRDFLRVTGTLAVASSLPRFVRGAEAKTTPPETLVKELFDKMNSDQKKAHCFPFDHPLRSRVSANWNITEPKIEDLTEVQQDLVERIFKGLCTEDGFERFQKQMADDGGGMANYHFAIFGAPGEDKFEFVMTGRHMTIRADGNTIDGVAFGGPMVYGHAAEGFVEKPHHPGNVFWYQAKQANEVFKALDSQQRSVALLEKAPKEDDIALQKKSYPGLAVGSMTPDQKELVKKVMADLLSPYRRQDADEVMQLITQNGGLEKIHLAFFKNDAEGKSADLGNDGVWDIWRLQGPGFVWHFRGAPHVHTWVNIAKV